MQKQVLMSSTLLKEWTWPVTDRNLEVDLFPATLLSDLPSPHPRKLALKPDKTSAQNPSNAGLNLGVYILFLKKYFSMVLVGGGVV